MKLMDFCSSRAPPVALTEEDHAAIYFSSGTTGFPKAILHDHRSLTCACMVEQNHHGQTREDVFLCIPPFYFFEDIAVERKKQIALQEKIVQEYPHTKFRGWFINDEDLIKVDTERVQNYVRITEKDGKIHLQKKQDFSLQFDEYLSGTPS